MTAYLPIGAPLRLKELLPHEVAGVLGRDSRLIVPCGTCQQHGPHLPLGCDTIIAERLAADLSARFGVLLAPTMEYGVNEQTERAQPGNSAMRRKTLHRALNDLLDQWEAGGITEFILLTVHSHDPHQEALATVVTTRARVRVVDALGVRMDDLLDDQHVAMHGGEVDTSLMLYLAPNLVRMDLARDRILEPGRLRRYRRGRHEVPDGGAGSLGKPTIASVRKGELIYRRILDQVSDRIFGGAVAGTTTVRRS